MKVAKVNFNDCIGAQFFGGGITEQFVRYCVEGPNSFDPAAAPAYPEAVELHFFNCPGGEVYEGYGIYTYLRTLVQQGIKVTAYVHGLCASIASVIVLAADERLIGPLGQIMTHKPMCDVGPWGNADDHAKAVLELNKLQDQIVGVYALRTGQPTETLHAMMNAETFLYPAEAIAAGFATGPMPEATVEAAPVVASKVLNYAKVPLTPTPAAMATLTKKEEEGLFTRFANWLAGQPKNEAEPAPAPVTNGSAEVTGGDTMYYTGDTLAVDTAVYSDEAMTVAYPDGDHALADGRTATVAAGIVTALADAATEDNATATAQNTADLDAAKARIAELEGQLSVSNRTVTGLTNKLAAVVPSSPGSPTPPGMVQNLINKPGAAAPATTPLINIRRS